MLSPLLVAFATLTAVAFLAPVARADAPVPTHDVGDNVGFGATLDLGLIADPVLDQIRLLDDMDANITINQLELTGSSDIWVTMEVVGETPDSYSIQTESAAGLRLHFVADVTSTHFPLAGTYPGNTDLGGCLLPTFPYATETIFAEAQIDLLETSSGLSTWTVSSFALQDEETNTSYELRSTVTMRNFPTFDFNLTACEFTVAYEDSALTLTADVELGLRVLYAPALDYFDFPIADLEIWSANSSATQGGNIRGTIDLVGLDPQEEADFFESITQALESSGFSVSGLTEFPVVLEDVTILLLGTAYLQDGVIHDITAPVDLTLDARERSITLADGNLHTVYLISETPGSPYVCGWVYSPDDGFIVGYRCEVDGTSVFELPNVPANTAEAKMADTKQKYVVFAAPTNALGDFFVKPPFLGLLLVAVVAILGVALVMLRRRRPAMPPPSAPPPQMGPPDMPPQAPPPGQP
jgi:hypothetical protein